MNHSITTSKLARCLAQANRARSVERTLSLRRVPSRLGEGTMRGQRTLRGLAQASPFMPRREHSSLKNNVRRLRNKSRNKDLGESLIISPRRDWLAWARKPVLATIFSYNSQDHKPNHALNQSKTDTTPTNPYKHEKTSKTAGKHK